MIKGSLQARHGTYYVVINYKDEFDKPKQKWINTNLREKGNKTKANAKMKEILKSFHTEDLIKENNEVKKNILFINFLQEFLQIKKTQVEPTTNEMYKKLSCDIIKYFKKLNLCLKDIKPIHIEGFYQSLYKRDLSHSSVLKYHSLIRQCLQYAFINDLVVSNVADKVKRPKKEKFKANFYSSEEMKNLFDVLENEEIKLPILLAAIYGFRRSEVVGLKWNAIDFENKLISIQHKVIETKIDGKRVIYKSDKLKNQTSNRTLPLLPIAERLLKDARNKIEDNKKNLGNMYDMRYLDYVCVDNMGRLILPARITHGFGKILKKNNLRKIRFHDLRHSCASLMLSGGVPMKQIQEWLGHADFSTTANIYSHLDYSSKIKSANIVSNIFNFNNEENSHTNIKENSQRDLENEIKKLKLELDELKSDKELNYKNKTNRREKNDFEM